MNIARSFGVLAVAVVSCTKGTSPDECRAKFNEILSQYETSAGYAATRFEHNPVPALNNHDSLVIAVNKAVDVANAAAANPKLSDCSGWNKLPHIQ